MAKVLVTGMSGTGKSSVLRVLGERGHRVVDTDTDEWSEWVGDGWNWREGAIAALLDAHEHGHLFLAGCHSNQGRFYDRLDAVYEARHCDEPPNVTPRAGKDLRSRRVVTVAKPKPGARTVAPR